MPINNPNQDFLYALRGAITCESNSSSSINSAVEELLHELIKRNQLIPDKVISITFSITKDLDACFPAAVARKMPGWEKIALLDCQQMYVKGDLKKCIRILALVFLPLDQAPKHVYLKEAKQLRPDR